MSKAVQRIKEKRKSSDEDYEEQENLKLSSSDIKRASQRMQYKLRKEKWVKRVDWCKEKAQAAFWTGLSILLVFQTRLFTIFFCMKPIPRDGILICVGILAAILFFGGFYLPYIRRQRHDMDVSHPQLIYIASTLIMSIIVLSFVGFWPFYSYWTLALIPVLCMGYMMSMHFLPNGLVGGIAFVAANGAIVFLQYHFDANKHNCAVK